jgi:DNA-binding beta-propeller fold protein YncE
MHNCLQSMSGPARRSGIIGLATLAFCLSAAWPSGAAALRHDAHGVVTAAHHGRWVARMPGSHTSARLRAARVHDFGPGLGLEGASGFGRSLLALTPTGVGPSGIAVDPATGTIYVANGQDDIGPNPGGNTVSVISTRACHAEDISSCTGLWPTITVGDEPSTIAVDVPTDTVYVTNIDDNTVSVFNGATCNAEDFAGCTQTAATVPVGNVPNGVYVDEANHTVYVPNIADGTVSMIDSSTCNARRLTACPTNPPPTVTVDAANGGADDIDVDQDMHTAYVAVAAGVAAFDTNTCNASTQAGCGAVGMLSNGDFEGVFADALDPANDTLYTANGDSTISVFDLRGCNAADLGGCATDAQATVDPPQSPKGFDESTSVTVDTADHTVYVPFPLDDALMVIDANRCKGDDLAGCASLDPREIHTGEQPEAVALDPLTQTLYATDQASADVSVIDSSQCNATVTAGCRPLVPVVPVAGSSTPLADPRVDTLYVRNGTDQIGMLDTSRCNAFHFAGCLAAAPAVTVGNDPFAFTLDGRTHTIYSANGDGTVSVIDASKCNARLQTDCADTASMRVPAGSPNALVVDPLTGTLYVSTDGPGGSEQELYVFDAAICNAHTHAGCDQTPQSVDVGLLFPSDIDVDLATNTVYVSSLSADFDSVTDGYVSVIAGRTCDAQDEGGCGKPIPTVAVGLTPQGLAVDQATDTIYTANQEDLRFPGTVSVIDGATCNGQDQSGCDNAPASAPAGFGPINIAIDQNADRVYVEDNADTSISMLLGEACNSRLTAGCNRTPRLINTLDYPDSVAVDPPVGTLYIGGGPGGLAVLPIPH